MASVCLRPKGCLVIIALLGCLSLASAFLVTPSAVLSSRLAPCGRLPFRNARSIHSSARGLSMIERAPRTPPAEGKNLDKKSGIGMHYTCKDGTQIAYDFVPAANPTIVYLAGLNQTRYDGKYNTLQSWCKRNNYGYLSADYFGVGASGGDFKDACISRWTQDTIALLENVVQTPVIIVGSGVGGWVMLHVALQCPDQVKGLVGIAADPDFTKDLVVPQLNAATLKEIEQTGYATIKWGVSSYMISKALIEDAEKNLLMQKGEKSIDIRCPVRLLQGLKDEEIPSDRALKLCNALKTTDVVVTYVKDGKHTLDDEEDVRLIQNDVKELAEKFFDYDLRSPTSG